MKRPSPRQIEAFLAVAETGSFSGAATRLGMAQPGVSQTIRDLESLLELRLFDRTTRRVILTQGGAAFREDAIKALIALDHAVAGARDRASLRQGTVRLAAPPFLAATVLPGILAAFQHRHPGLTLALTDTTTERILEGLRDGLTDLAIGTFPPGEADLTRRTVLKDEMMAFAHPGLGLPGTPQWTDLADRPMIVMGPGSALRMPAEIGFETAGLSLHPAFQVDQIATALALAQAGMGIALLPGYARAGLPSDGPTRALPLGPPMIRRELVLIHAGGRSLSSAAAALADHLAQSLRRLAP